MNRSSFLSVLAVSSSVVFGLAGCEKQSEPVAKNAPPVALNDGTATPAPETLADQFDIKIAYADSYKGGRLYIVQFDGKSHLAVSKDSKAGTLHVRSMADLRGAMLQSVENTDAKNEDLGNMRMDGDGIYTTSIAIKGEDLGALIQALQQPVSPTTDFKPQPSWTDKFKVAIAYDTQSDGRHIYCLSFQGDSKINVRKPAEAFQLSHDVPRFPEPKAGTIYTTQVCIAGDDLGLLIRALQQPVPEKGRSTVGPVTVLGVERAAR